MTVTLYFITGMSLYMALSSTSFAGIMKLVSAAIASLSITSPDTTTHLSNSLPSGALSAFIMTVASLAYSPEPEPPVTVTLYFITGAGLISFQTAVTVVFMLTVILLPTAYSVRPIFHALNSLPSGALNSHAGRV